MTDREISARSYRDIIDAIDKGEVPMDEMDVEYTYEPDDPEECEGWACGYVVGYDALCERVLLNLDNSDWVTNGGFWLYEDGTLESIGMGSWGGCPTSVGAACGRKTYAEDGCILY